jgi:hypothetical protein
MRPNYKNDPNDGPGKVLFRLQADISGPAKAFDYLTDAVVFMIFVRIGFSINDPQPGHKTRGRKMAKTVSFAAPCMAVLLSLSYIGFLCNFVSTWLRNGSGLHYLTTALQIDLACSLWMLSLSCLISVYAISVTTRVHNHTVPTVRLQSYLNSMPS